MSHRVGYHPERSHHAVHLSLQDPVRSWIGVSVVTLILAYLVQKVLLFYGFPILSLSEGLWNSFVYLMPSSLVFALRPKSAPSLSAEAGEGPGQHAAKSEVLRNVFGLDKTPGLFRNRTSNATPPGLGNWDNSCYQNSVLQAFASVNCLREFLEKVPHGDSGGTSPDTTLSALHGIIRDLNDRANSGRHIWTPATLKSMSSWQQQDAQEYFSKIVDQMEKDIAAAVREQHVSHEVFELRCSGLVAEDEESSEGVPKHAVVELSGSINIAGKAALVNRSHCKLQNPLEGLLAQRVGCIRCGYTEGLSLIPFNCMTLPLGKEWVYDIRDCLDAYTNLEYIEGVECAKCTLLQSKRTLYQLHNQLANSEKDKSQAAKVDEAYKHTIDARLEAVTEALFDEDFAEATLSKKCEIPSRLRASTTKSRQAIVMRAPKCLVMHVNRSLFDETTGAQLKNHADVKFPTALDIGQWCVGNKVDVKPNVESIAIEKWQMDPSRSMLQNPQTSNSTLPCLYKLQAVITHLGKHENGHYVCYRRVQSWLTSKGDSLFEDTVDSAHAENGEYENWWRLSDEDVSKVTEGEVLAQGGAFMLFYERVEQSHTLASNPSESATSAIIADDSLTKEIKPIEHDSVEEMTGRSNEATNETVSMLEASTLATPVPPPNPIISEIISTVVLNSPNGTAKEVRPARDGQEPEHAISSTLQAKFSGPSTMRTAGLTQRHSDDLSAFKPLHMVATS